ncbi:family 43 glycosylhydrolase [Bacteroidales bacterium OttesenSCG-928-J19]|nr:family 43 glycosylhydrolase [Bacteroidales bacterium OttesenSCG-928-J19]
MKRIYTLLVSLTLLIPFSAEINGQEYPKAILPGDYPDPSILRDGADYYMTHSPFYYMPGFLIWHSQDLMNWEPITRIIPEYEGSAMAPDLIKHEGRFYLYYPAKGTNWVVWADDIRGPWSQPIDLKVRYIDPGHVAGKDGKRYLHLSDGQVVQLADDGLSTVGELKKVYEGWEYPKHWKTEGMYLESPKLTYKDGYYYMTCAQGGTAGPPTSHMVSVARSENPTGPWENSPYNPMVHTYHESDNWWSKGHATIVDDVNGNWWIVYHAYANGYHTLGRQTLIEPIEWTADGWYRTKANAEPIIPQKPVRHGLELSDNFSGTELGLQWAFWKEYAPQSVVLKDQSLSVQAKGKTPADARKLLVTPTDKTYETQVSIRLEGGNQAGLMLFYSEKAYSGIMADNKNFTVYYDAENSKKVPNRFGKNFLLKIKNQGNRCAFLASKDGKDWTELARNVDVSGLHHNNYGGFFALRPALLSMGKGKSVFQDFRYKSAVPTEDEMSAYLMVYHRDETHGLYMALSNDGYTFTALNEDKPIMAGDTIADQKGIRDPHAYRGPDGAFYVAMTDLHVFAQRDGLRTTEWERDGAKYGWGNNKGLILMKSWDLINWKRTNIRFDELSSEYSEIGCAWAPEIIFDEKKGKLMIYYTMRFQTEPNKLYYVYVNEDFDKLESRPQILFEYPDRNVTALDADITRIGDKYYMFYVSHESGAGIKQAISDRINGDYHFDARWYDFEPGACEAPNVWKRIGEDKWVLMYDVYSVRPHNFGFTETSDFVNFKNLGRFNEGVMKATNFLPKHGAVIHLTRDEAERLAEHWGLDMQFK